MEYHPSLPSMYCIAVPHFCTAVRVVVGRAFVLGDVRRSERLPLQQKLLPVCWAELYGDAAAMAREPPVTFHTVRFQGSDELMIRPETA